MKIRTNVDPKPKKKKYFPDKKNHGKEGFAPKGQTEEDRKAIYSNDVGEIKKLIERKRAQKKSK